MLLTPSRRASGFTLVEMLVTITVLALLMAAGAPSLGLWISNSKVRSVAESLANDMRQAQSESITRNRQTVLALTTSAPSFTATPAEDGTRWFTRTLQLVSTESDTSAEDFIHGSTMAAEGGVLIDGPALTCFNSLGRPVANTSTTLGANCVAPTSATSPIKYTVSRTGADRQFVVEVYLGGKIRLCDKSKVLSDSKPDGCAA